MCDYWEIHGIDVDRDGVVDLDLPMLGADPQHKDLFLEVDAMDRRVPPAASMTQLINAFAPHGITLHLEESGENVGVDDINIPLAKWCNECDADPSRPVCPQGYAQQFRDVKDKYFGTVDQRRDRVRWQVVRKAKNKAYHYCVSVDFFKGSPTDGQYYRNGANGEGELPGNDCILALGELWLDRRLDERGKAGAIMHELGHNFGLRHGGDADAPGFKPNYHSVMNYVWAFPDPDYDTSWGLDYSDDDPTIDPPFFPPLNELQLDEPSGIAGHVGHKLKVKGPKGVHVVNESGPVDWTDNNNSTQTDVSVDINSWFGTEPPLDVHVGFNDWAVIDFSLVGAGAFRDGVYTCGAGELQVEEWHAMLDGYADCNNNGVADRIDVGACNSADCNGDGVPDDCQIAEGTKQDTNPQNGVPDECDCTVLSPATTPMLQVFGGYLSWDSEDATEFDIVRGDLMALRASDGNFTLAVDACVANDFGLSSIVADDKPAAGEAWFFVARGNNCAGNGSFDSLSQSQSGSRDVEIGASPHMCPAFKCGNGLRESGEVCDRWDLGCQTCQDHDFTSGRLRCNATCTAYDTSECTGP